MSSRTAQTQVGNGMSAAGPAQKALARLLRARGSWQAIGFALTNSYFLKSLRLIPCPTLNCYACPAANFACPIGTLQHFAATRRMPLFALGILAVTGTIFGRAVCGWACPVGGLQELLHRVRARKLRISNRLGFLRYLVLAGLVFVVPFLTGEPWFSKLCFVGTLQAGVPLALASRAIRSLIGPLFWMKLAIAAALLALMLFVKRPFCRFICPLGALYSPFNKVAPGFVVVRPELCVECRRCTEICPMDLDVPREVNGLNCIRCRECVGFCRALEHPRSQGADVTLASAAPPR